MKRRLCFHGWNAVGRVLRWVGDRLHYLGIEGGLALHGLSGTTDSIADDYRPGCVPESVER